MRRLLVLLLVLFPSLVSAQPTLRAAGAPGSWMPASEKGCIGGSTCRDRQLRVALQDRPVVAIRFRAHDQIGTKADGSLRVKIDGNTVESYIDIPRRGELFTLDVDELRGRWLVFEPASNDEVEISDIAVLYSTDTMRIPRDRDRGRWDDRPGRGRDGAAGPGWRAYRQAEGCIGGDDCRKNGSRITVALADQPVLGVRFHAHDSIGQRADGKLTVRIDDETIASYIDVQRSGRVHEFDVDELYGSKLIIEAANDDEVEISGLEILYGRAPRRDGRDGRGGYDAGELRHEGGCIGGAECGGRRAEIRIDLRGRPVESIRLYARDDIGTRAGGELRIRIDDEILEYALDIPREGRTFTIDGKNIAGDYLIIEPAENDEVMIRDIRVQLRRSY